MMETRPWTIAVNRAAYHRRHKVLIDGRLYAVIIPLAVFSMVGWFVDPRFILFLMLALCVWGVGVVQWQRDAWYLTRAFINLDSPRRGPAAKRNRPLMGLRAFAPYITLLWSALRPRRTAGSVT